MGNTDKNNGTIIIFSHYGFSSFLKYTLACARFTNPKARLIFLGDENNRSVACQEGWEHYLFKDYKGICHEKFHSVFRHVQGRKHLHIKGGKDWLKYVFERWYFIQGFCSENKIERFWHFDSDTMIVDDLSHLEDVVAKYDFSTQCNNTCLNGIVSTEVATEFCHHICALFQDKDLMDKQQFEFDTLHPRFAFTEMRAFHDYKKNTRRPWIYLMDFKKYGLFDDCLAQSHGYKMNRLPCGRVVKKCRFIGNRFFVFNEGGRINLLTINLSWQEDYLFKWILSCIVSQKRKSLLLFVPIRLVIKAPGKIFLRFLNNFSGHRFSIKNRWLFF